MIKLEWSVTNSDEYYYSESAVYVTTDAGTNWRYAKTGTRLRNLQALSPEKLYISEMKGWMSRDSGKTWTAKNEAAGVLRDMLFLDSLNVSLTTCIPIPPGYPMEDFLNYQWWFFMEPTSNLRILVSVGCLR